jgi:hypothetical protein
LTLALVTRAFGLLLAGAEKALELVVESGAQGLTCSEFVFRCFQIDGVDEVEILDPLHPKYSLRNSPPNATEGDGQSVDWPTPDQLEKQRQLDQDYIDYLESITGQRNLTPSVPDNTTPGDFWRSPSFEAIAVLHQPPHVPAI